MQRNSRTHRRSSMLFDVWLVTHLTTHLLDEELRGLGLTADEFGLYSLLEELGPLSPTQVVRWTGMAPTTVSGMVRRLTARGHLTQEPHPDDARSRLLELTEDGSRTAASGSQRLAELMPRLLEALGPHAAEAHLGLRRLDRALRAVVGAAARPDAPLAGETASAPPRLAYDGPPLTQAQEREVRRYVRWVRDRDADDSS